MFERQLREMRGNLIRILGRPKPPETILILKEHADYLKVKRVPSNKNKPKRETPPTPGEVRPIIKVRVLDLYNAAKNAKGVDYEEPYEAEKRKRDSNESADQPREECA